MRGDLTWPHINDGVMGGRSDGRFKINEDKKMEFYGTLSLENNGGFASVRTLPREFGLAEATGLIIRVLGDGRSYQLRLRTDASFDGVAWRFGFDTTPGEWTTVTAPLFFAFYAALAR